MFDWFKKKEETPAEDGRKRFAFLAGQRLRMLGANGTKSESVQTVVQEDRGSVFSVLAPSRREDWGRGVSVRASLYAESGVYSFTTTVVRSYVHDNVMMLDLAKPQQVRRFQRRKYKRVAIVCSVEYDVVFDAADDREYVSRARTVFSRDISASGICIRTERFVAPGSLCRLQIMVPGMRRGAGAVARVMESLQDSGVYQYLTRMEYIGIMEKNRILIDDIVNDMGGT